MTQTIGKFEVRSLLGRGAQSLVYLAYDPDLQREVAIKRLARLPALPGRIGAVHAEARTVSKLRHPNIVPIFEMGDQDGQVHLVFEYVAGRTLQQLLAKEGALPPRRAAELMAAVLQAIEQAHAKGVIHRDLKPSNILVEADGRPRVMDFGIATKPCAEPGLEQDLLGTPAYMAPEYITQRRVTEQYDVFSAGLVLFEALFGQPAVQGGNAFQAIHQIANLPLVFPADAVERIDGRLHDIVAKATAKEPELRYASARQMREALEEYLRPPVGTGAADNGRQSTLEFLLRRMRVKTDFPAMSAAINAIQRLAASDRADINQLSNSILKDFALTNKILRIVNSVCYPNRSGEQIRTVSRAIVMLGFDAVRSIAISLMLFEHISDKKHAGALKDEFLRANLGAMLARELGQQLVPGQSEDAFICALFHDLGRLLTCYYFWEEAEAIGKLVATEGCAEDAAAARVLGISYQDLGIGVAQSWGFPEPIINSMRRLPAGKPARPHSTEERLRLISAFASEVCRVLEVQPEAGLPTALAQLLGRYGDSLPLGTRELTGAVSRSVGGLKELADSLQINLQQSRFCHQLLPPPEKASVAKGGCASPGVAPDLQAAVLPAPAGASTEAHSAEQILAAGIQDISKALVEDFPLNDLLRIIAETIYRAIPVRRVLMCTSDGEGRMRGRFGFGADCEAAVGQFEFTLGGSDLFNLILGKDADVLIRDATEPRIQARLPAWYKARFAAPSFIVFPMRVRNQPAAMIYADAAKPGEIAVSSQELSLLHTLRNQAVLAIKQSG